MWSNEIKKMSDKELVNFISISLFNGSYIPVSAWNRLNKILEKEMNHIRNMNSNNFQDLCEHIIFNTLK